MPAGSTFSGCTFSILGDSISTLKGYLPPYCKSFYLQNPRAVCSGISKPMDTWWARVISAFEGRLCINNSFSGCLVSGMDFPCATHLLRYHELHCNPGAYHFILQDGTLRQTLSREKLLPDVILVYLGTNDWIFHAPIDPEGNGRDYFNIAYPLLLQKLRDTYPGSRIVCATLFQSDLFVPDARHPVAEYNAVIREAAAASRCSLAELTDAETMIETIDGIHPTYQGMQLLAQRWIRSMT